MGIIVLAGCGKMGGALLRAWLKDSDLLAKHQFSVIDPQRPVDPADGFSYAASLSSAKDIIGRADMLVLAVKPQTLHKTAGEIAAMLGPQTGILSVAAGISLERLQGWFGGQRPVIRAMPNLPAATGHGVTVITGSTPPDSCSREMAEMLMRAAGSALWLEDETLMDAVTAVSGSGPAYVFHLIEVLENSALTLGLPADIAAALARETVTGSAAYAQSMKDTPAADLRRNVTSPGGTTEAALDVLMDGRLQALFNDALIAARDRGKTLNQKEK